MQMEIVGLKCTLKILEVNLIGQIKDGKILMLCM